MSTPKCCYDCKGIEIMIGDTLKILHFIGPRKKKYYMHKYVEGYWRHKGWARGVRALKISHLNPRNEHYIVMINGMKLEHCEIVQGYGDDSTPYHRRKKVDAARKGGV